MSEEPRSDVRTDWRGVLPAMLIFLALVGGGLVWQAREDARAAEAERARVAAEGVKRHATAPAPNVRKGKSAIIKGRKMSAWIASGAGDSAYDGTYTENGTYDSAPAYTNGSKWMYKTAESGGQPIYSLGPTKGDANSVYVAADGPLPGSYWMVTVEGVSEPAPTVAAAGGTAVDTDTDTDPYGWPWGNWWWDGPYFAAAPPIAPGLVTVDGTLYVVFCVPDDSTYSFLTFDTSAHTWAYLSYDNAPFAAWDTGQSGCLIDAGDGENVWCLSGGHLDGATPQFVCSKHSLLTGARASQQAVTLENATITNMVSMDGGTTARFCERSTGTIRYHSYTLGASSYTELFEAAAGSWPGLPVGWTDSTVRHLLYRSTAADVYYLRHADKGVTPYRLTSSAAERLESLTATTGGSYDGAGEYLDSILVAAPTDDWRADVWKWKPGESWQQRAGLGLQLSGRHWLLPDAANNALYVAGWQDAASTRPYVALIAPATITAESATLSLTAADMSIAERIGMEAATVALTASDVSIKSVERLFIEPAQVALVASDVTIIGAPNRTPGVVTAQFEWVRARALV